MHFWFLLCFAERPFATIQRDLGTAQQTFVSLHCLHRASHPRLPWHTLWTTQVSTFGIYFLLCIKLESAQSYVYEPQGRHFTTLWCYSSGTPDERQPDERSPPPFFFSRPAFLKLKKKYFPVNEAMTKLYYSFKTSFCFLFRVVFVIAIVFIP